MTRSLVRGLALAWLAFGAESAPGQPPLYFNNRYALSPIFSLGTQVLPNSNGFIIASQVGQTPNRSQRDVALSFVDSAGVVQQTRFYQHRTSLVQYTGLGDALVRTADGGLVVTGTALPASGPNQTLGVLWRFNARGDTLWTRVYTAGGGWLKPEAVCQLADGGFALVGNCTNAAGATDRDFLVVRTDALGHEQWRRRINLRPYDNFFRVLATPDGGVLATGQAAVITGGAGPWAYKSIAYKLDSTGQVQWNRQWGGRYINAATQAQLTPDGGYLIAGVYSDSLLNILDARQQAQLTKLSASGTVEWQRRYGPYEPYVTGWVLRPLPAGGYVLAGQMNAGGNVLRAFALRVCADGDSVWYRTYHKVAGASIDNYFGDLLVAADGGLVGVGNVTPSPPTGTQDMWLFRTDANGYLLPGGAPPPVVCVTGVPPALPPAAPEVALWPNPAPDGRYWLRVGGGGRLALLVTDALGRVVWRGGGAAGGEMAVDVGRQPPGVYTLRLTWADGRTITKKLLR